MIEEEEARAELIKYRLEQSQKMVEVSTLLIANNATDSAINRIYYGMFYAVLALALQNNYETSKHQQLLGWFNKEFIHTNKIDIKYGRMLKIAFEWRMKSDYETLTNFTLQEAEQMLTDMQEFLIKITEFINK